MPRKPIAKKHRLMTVVDGKTVQISLHPPTGQRTSWYVFWTGLKTSKSTGQSELEEAKRIAIQMAEGKVEHKSELPVPTDEEFDEVQKRHYSKKQGDKARKRSDKSLLNCMEAVEAFRQIMGIKPITMATPEDCERFENLALKLPKNWRVNHPKKRKEINTLSPYTVVKWTTALRAAFERVNMHAGRKCVRAVVPQARLLTQNPWNMFTSIDVPEPEKRHLSPNELIDFMAYLVQNWGKARFAPTMLKLFFWSAARREEIAGLKWSDLREAHGQYHFFWRANGA